MLVSMNNEGNLDMVGSSRGYGRAGGEVLNAGGHTGDAGYGVDLAGGPGGGGGSGGSGYNGNPESLRGSWDEAPGIERLMTGSYNWMGTIGGKGALESVFSSAQPPRPMMGPDGKPIGQTR